MKPEEIGERIRELREKRGLSQEMLGSMIFSAGPSISRIEGGAVPTFDLLVRLLDGLDAELILDIKEK